MENGGVNLDAEKLKIQKFQMYLQFASVILSAGFLYMLMRKNQVPAMIEEDFTGDDE